MKPRRGLLMLAAAALASSGPAAAAGGPRVEFVEPRHNSTVIGSTAIELRVSAPAGVAIERVELTVDGEPLATLTAPPWRATWDAGDGSEGHRLAAVLYLAGGIREQANIRTAALRINHVEQVGLVPIYPIVRDRSGNYVSGLTRERFRVYEDGLAQSITRFSTERKPLRIGLVLDTSQSMENGSRLADAQRGALEFLDVLQAGDEGMVVTFNDSVTISQGLTSDRGELVDAVGRTQAKGGTALYDAIWRTSKKLAAFDGRRVLVLLSDGKDESYDGLEPGSLHTLEESLHQALRSEVMVFAIGLGRRFGQELDFERQRTLKEILDELAVATGGRALFTPRSGQLRRAFRQIADDLRNQYTLAYVSSDPERDGRWRTIEVRVPDLDVEVTSRKGYFAGPPQAQRSPD